MTMTDTQSSGDSDSGWTVVTGRTITKHDRVISIPKQVAENRNIGDGDLVDLRIYAEYSPESIPVIEMNEALVRTRRRITIPEHRLAVHALERGDRADIEIRPTGLHYAGYEPGGSPNPDE